jgi:hypothetical protein
MVESFFDLPEKTAPISFTLIIASTSDQLCGFYHSAKEINRS